jgi:hypothetical protein
MSGAAAVVLALPVCFGWVNRAFEIWWLPDKVNSQNKLLMEMRDDVRDIKKALHVPSRTPKQREKDDLNDYYEDAMILTNQTARVN